MADNQTPSVNPIAIISVHGVADQLPYDSARQIAKLLLDHNPQDEENRPYQSFVEKEFYLPESRNFKDLPILEQARKNPSNQAETQDVSYDFLLEQLIPRESNPESLGVFKSLRLEGSRQSTQTPSESDEDGAQPIHIYEMYWADLSRLQNDFFRIFGEFYQILFHLSRIGRRSVGQLKAEFGSTDKSLWNAYEATQIWAEGSLTLGIPILNILMLVTAFAMLPLWLSPAQLEGAAIGSTTLAGLILFGEILWRSPQAPLAGLKKPKSIACIAILLFSAICYWSNSIGLYHYITVLAAGLFYLVTKIGITSYAERRPHANEVASWASFIWAVFFLGLIFHTGNDPNGVIWACLRTIEILFVPLVAVWLLFHGSQIAAFMLGILVTWRTQGELNKSKVQRGTWTARLSLSLPSAVFLLVTLTLWYAIARVSSSLIPEGTRYSPLIPRAFLGKEIELARDFAETLIVAASTSAFTAVGITLLIALAIGIFVMLPSIGAEIFRKTYTDNSDITHRFERWLTRGLKWLYLTTELVTVCMVLFSIWSIFILGLQGLAFFPSPSISNGATHILSRIDPFIELKPTLDVLDLLSLVIASSATSLFALGSRLAKFTSGIRNLLDVILDVDSYLRVHPKGNNPKAQIFSRYLSLLRYICRWPDSDQSSQKYRAIIIIAHSQGTVITADLLRFLQKFLIAQTHDSSLERLDPDYHSRDALPIYLFTMGSPLKQLYNVAFPSLYHWLDDLKDLDSFGLKYWLNVYCTGDYVGRSLWGSAKKPRPAGFGEKVLGAGAHTHYWDSTIPKVAEYLDQLIIASSQSETLNDLTPDEKSG